jgi:hypothetical protein
VAAQPHQWSNIALRPPDDVIGLDCDAYGGKHGDQTLAQLVDKFGELPATWTSGNRPDDLPSRISWYRVPAGLVWPGKLPGGDMEIIQHGHRYAIVWPSIHPSGRPYFWARPGDGIVVDGAVPTPVELAQLPAAWVAGLTEGKTAQPRPGVVVDERMGDHGPDNLDARRWLTPGEPCQAVVRALDGFDGASRHDTMVQLQVRLLRLGEQGHRGVRAALDTLESMFVAAVVGDGSRTDSLAADEWQRALNDAPAVILRKGLTPAERRGCCVEPLPTLDELARRYGIGQIDDKEQTRLLAGLLAAGRVIA